MSRYTVTLPSAGLVGRRTIKPILQFQHHDTFAAYLQAWADAGFSISWPSGLDAVIGSENDRA